MSKDTPYIAEPTNIDEVLAFLQAADQLDDMVWALRDWAQAAQWLTDQGAPDLNEFGNTMPMKDRFLWVIESRKI